MPTDLGRRILDFVKQPVGWLSIVAVVLVMMCCYAGAVMGGLLPGIGSGDKTLPPANEVADPAPSAQPLPPTPTVAPLPLSPEPVLTSSPTGDPRCHPNYSVCLPIVRKLSCNQIRQRDFDVIGGKDPYGLDPDRDGKACERRRD